MPQRWPSCEIAWARQLGQARKQLREQAQAERELQLSLLHNTLGAASWDRTIKSALDFFSVAVDLAGDFFSAGAEDLAGDFFSAGAAFTGAGLLAASGAGAAFFCAGPVLLTNSLVLIWQ